MSNLTKIRTQVYIDEDILQQAKILARATDRSLSELIRQGLANILNQSIKKTKPKLRITKLDTDEKVYGNWDKTPVTKTSPEFIFVARKT